MKVLLINGSPDGKGCIHTALTLAAEVLNKEGIETEEIHVGNKDIRGCIACRRCKQTGKCVFNDLVNEVAPKLVEADGANEPKFRAVIDLAAADVEKLKKQQDK